MSYFALNLNKDNRKVDFKFFYIFSNFLSLLLFYLIKHFITLLCLNKIYLIVFKYVYMRFKITMFIFK